MSNSDLSQADKQRPNRPRRRVYFQPGQVLLLVEHPAEYEQQRIINRLNEKTDLIKMLGDLDIDPERGDILTFRHTPRIDELPRRRQPTTNKHDGFSLVFVETSERARRPRDLIDLIGRLNDYIDRERRRNPSDLVLLCSCE
jgi:hypothetical protein